uniref:Uncharacterized protein n=1 Tax=Medicago truncatula TaxID=3880 RepID=A2Q311_MEDTR|nr:hypothetical protein MtrDRAFT_AC154113g7v2 [Medicago truncatula]
MRRGMRTGQTLFPLRIEPGIFRVRPWKELLAIGAQATCCKSVQSKMQQIRDNHPLLFWCA